MELEEPLPDGFLSTLDMEDEATRTQATQTHDRDRLLTVGEAARILRVRDADARRWLEEHGLIIRICGRRRVHRGRMMEVLMAPSAEEAERSRAKSRRKQLRIPVPMTKAF